MISYASMTQGARNLAMLRRCGWRVLVSPAHNTLDAQGFQYALDNGAWAYYRQGRQCASTRAARRGHRPTRVDLARPRALAALGLTMACDEHAELEAARRWMEGFWFDREANTAIARARRGTAAWRVKP